MSSTDQEQAEDIPLSVQSIITQTDKNGVAKKLSAPTYDTGTRSSSSDINSKKPFLQRIFGCCVQRPKGNILNNTVDKTEYSNTTDQGVREVLTRKPAKMPDIYSTTQPKSKKCLVLDLDETLVHSSFQPVAQAHYTIPVTIEGIVHNVFVIKRPGVDEFLRLMGEHYEVIIYTASLSKYADPLLDELDVSKVISSRLFRENCVFYDGHYVKDLSLLNRNLTQTIIIDNSPMSYIFHPENAIDCSTFIDDPEDCELWQIADFLVGIKGCDDVRKLCRSWRDWSNNNNNNNNSSSSVK